MNPRVIVFSIGLLFLTARICPADQPWESSERKGLTALNKMIDWHDLDQSQIEGIKYTLREQREMIELFTKYGLLGEGELQKKFEEIADLTRSRLDAVLTREQIGRWATIESKLDEKMRDERRSFSVFSIAKP